MVALGHVLNHRLIAMPLLPIAYVRRPDARLALIQFFQPDR